MTEKRKSRLAPDPVLLRKANMRFPDILRKLGWPGFRSGQDVCITRVCGGMDAVVCMPTGQGKSAVYLVPTMAMGWKTLVFSPLLSLMKDQVESAAAKGLRAAQVNSNLSKTEIKQTLRHWTDGNIDILFAPPERMKNPEFMEAMKACGPDMVAVDEAHVIAQWGTTFRSAYAHIGEFIDTMGAGVKVVLALTATATDEVVSAIKESLRIPNATNLVYMPRRTNLHMSAGERTTEADLVNRIRQIEGSTIVYFSTKPSLERTAAIVGASLQSDNRRVGVYHGDMQPKDREAVQNEFMDNKISVMFATNAFGMGVDKPDVRHVIHWEHGRDVESVIQEWGRGGRDGKPSWCYAYTSKNARSNQEHFISQAYPSEATINSLHRHLMSISGGLGKAITKTQSSMAYDTGIEPQQVSSAMQIMARFGVLDKVKSDDKSVTITLLDVDRGDKRITAYVEGIIKTGQQVSPNTFKVLPAALSRHMGVGEATVSKYLREMSSTEEGFRPVFTLTKAFTGNSTTVKEPNTEKVDFSMLRREYAKAIDKLDTVIKFLRMPDNEKPDFLDAYFHIKRKAFE